MCCSHFCLKLEDSFLKLIHVCFFVFSPEERARIYSSDSDEGSDDDKAQRLMKAKKLDSDEVGALSCWTDRGQFEAGLCGG